MSKINTIGFGFDIEHDHCGFIVNIQDSEVLISEHLNIEYTKVTTYTVSQDTDPRLRVVLPRDIWNIIAEPAKHRINEILMANNMKRGRWKKGVNLMSRGLGKALVVLVWAIEDTDQTHIQHALECWDGLCEADLWWLYNMTNAGQGSAIKGRAYGWRKALRYMIAENEPVYDLCAHRSAVINANY